MVRLMPDISLTNSSFGPYTLREQISAGGIAEVYRGEHNDDHKSVAIKVMRAEKQADKYHRQGFEDEFEFLKGIKHAGLPGARRQGEIKGRICFAMDYFSGFPVHQVVRMDKPWDRVKAFYELVSIVAYLHGERIIHADLKLENVILRPTGNVALVDFGNARKMETKSFFARLFGAKKDRVFGTPTYLAPELLKGKQPSYASDVYALGVCAFIMLSGEPPFDASSRTGRLKANLNNEAPSIRTRCVELPMRAAQSIDRCLDKEPSERPGDANTLLGLIKELQQAGSDTTRIPRKSVSV
jgi:eukaryotic-like serine/threonine-protein kinase